MQPETWSTGHQWQGWPLGETRHIRYIRRAFPGPHVKELSLPAAPTLQQRSCAALIRGGSLVCRQGTWGTSALPLCGSTLPDAQWTGLLLPVWSSIFPHAPAMSVLGPESSWMLGAATQIYTTPSDHCCPSHCPRVWSEHKG